MGIDAFHLMEDGKCEKTVKAFLSFLVAAMVHYCYQMLEVV
jgi:hypothetical protein